MKKLLFVLIIIFAGFGVKGQQVALSEYRWTPVDAEGDVTGRHKNGFTKYEVEYFAELNDFLCLYA